MTTQEFSNAFDVLLNSYSSQAEFGDSHSASDIILDEYEKSLLLTQAQEELVIDLYTGRSGKEAFEGTEELRQNLRDLIKTGTPTVTTGKGLSKNSKFFILPKDVLFITYEYATIDDEAACCSNGSEIIVKPITQDDFYRANKNPFRQANKRRALRLDSGSLEVEVVSPYNIKDYTIRYLSKPTPIILANFDGGLSINNESTVTDCKLDSSMHKYILERAVALALASRASRVQK